MKVCLVTTSFPRWPHDARQLSMLETARALRDHGVSVRVIALHAPNAKIREMVETIEVVRPRYMWPERLEVLQNEGGGLPAVWRKNVLARLEFPLAGAAQALATMRFARECDVIHAHWTLSAMAVWAGRFYHRRPFVVTVHGSDIFQATRIPFVGRMTKAVLSQAHHVVAVSRSLADATIALGVPAAHLEVIPGGIDIERFHPGTTEREPLLLFVGSLLERKGVKYLIKAMLHVRQKLPDYHLVIVGDGPQKDDLTHLVSELDLAEHVTLVGAQPQDEIIRWMRRSRLFVLPSLEEALGIVLLEALASGTPCVGTRVGGIPEVLSPEVGRLVPPADPEALANAIIFILEHRDLWQAMSQDARRRAEEHCYTWKKVATRLIEIYQSVMSTA